MSAQTDHSAEPGQKRHEPGATPVDASPAPGADTADAEDKAIDDFANSAGRPGEDDEQSGKSGTS